MPMIREIRTDMGGVIKIGKILGRVWITTIQDDGVSSTVEFNANAAWELVNAVSEAAMEEPPSPKPVTLGEALEHTGTAPSYNLYDWPV